jgi:hypothetical protein
MAPMRADDRKPFFRVAARRDDDMRSFEDLDDVTKI